MSIKRFADRISQRKRDIIIILLWAVAISVFMIRAYVTMYYYSPSRIAREFWSAYMNPHLEIPDLFIITLISIVGSIMLSDADIMIYGLSAALIIAFIIAVTFTALFLWYVMGAGEIFYAVAYGWEVVLYSAFWKMFFVMVPYVIGTSAIGLVVGIILRGWVRQG